MLEQEVGVDSSGSAVGERVMHDRRAPLGGEAVDGSSLRESRRSIGGFPDEDVDERRREERRDNADAGSEQRNSSKSNGGESGTASSCKGCLIFSQRLKENGRNPVCIGVRQTENVPGGTPLRRGESAAEKECRRLADFKYACIGYSLYRNSNPTGSPTEANSTAGTLPLCQGIEILADRMEGKQAGSPSPRGQSAGASPEPIEAADNEVAAGQNSPIRPPQSGTFRPLGGIAGVSQDEFAGRFIKSAGLISRRCYLNMARAGKAVKDGISGAFHSDRGRSK